MAGQANGGSRATVEDGSQKGELDKRKRIEPNKEESEYRLLQVLWVRSADARMKKQGFRKPPQRCVYYTRDSYWAPHVPGS